MSNAADPLDQVSKYDTYMVFKKKKEKFCEDLKVN